MSQPTVIGDCTLYEGDCLAVLPTLGKVDAVVTDPPYEAHMHETKSGCRGIRSDGYASPAPLDFASIGDVRESVMPILTEMTEGWLLAFCTPEGIAAWRDEIEKSARYKRACFWIKPDSAPQFNGQGPAFAVEPFVTAWCGSGHSRWNGGGRRNHFIHPTNQPSRHGDHPTEKPLSLMLELIEFFTNFDETVCDPFMGSGTTGVACAKLGRKFFGVELQGKYFDIACKRIEDAYKQGDFFIEPPKPKAEQTAFDLDAAK